MIEILKKKPLIVLSASILIGAGIGIVLSLILFSNDTVDLTSIGDRFVLATGESPGAPDIWNQPQIIDVWEEVQPLTLTAANIARWEKEVTCIPNVGYYSRRAAKNDLPEPYSLIFDNLDRVIGVYLFSENEQQPPWQSSQATGPYPYPHWGLHVFFQDSSNACN